MFVGGDGTFAQLGPPSYELDFGTVMIGAPLLEAELGVLNDVLALADELAGSWTTAAPDFGLSGFGPFDGLTAGSTLGDMRVTLDTGTQGNFTGTLTLSPLSENATGCSGPLPDVTVALHATVVPEPTSVAMLCGLVVCGMGVYFCCRARRRQRPSPSERAP